MGRPRNKPRGLFDNNQMPFLLSPEDYDLTQYSYHTSKKGYLCAWVGGRLKKLHQLVVQKLGVVVADSFVIDHINRDKRDNRRENLRITTQTGNSLNQKRLPKSSGYAGISIVPGVHNKKYRATFRKTRKCFHTVEEALAWRENKIKQFWDKELTQ